MLDYLTAAQLAEWRAYDQIEPIGGYREDYRMAQVCHLIFELAQSVYGDGNRRMKSSIYDFMPWGPEDPGARSRSKRQTMEEMKAVLMTIAAPKKGNKET